MEKKVPVIASAPLLSIHFLNKMRKTSEFAESRYGYDQRIKYKFILTDVSVSMACTTKLQDYSFINFNEVYVEIYSMYVFQSLCLYASFFCDCVCLCTSLIHSFLFTNLIINEWVTKPLSALKNGHDGVICE